MNRKLKIILPVAVLALGLGVSGLLIKAQRSVAPVPREVLPPLVRVTTVSLENYHFQIPAQGSVTPATEVTLAPEVSGRIVSVSPALAAGGFFEAGEVLIELDPRDFELALTRARAAQAEAEVRVLREQAESDVARKEWQSLGRGEPNPLLVREPQLAEARAALDSAQAVVAQAELNLERTKVEAPFAGRVREKNADVGGYVAMGSPVARIYSVEFAEVRLPLALDQLAFLDLPLEYRGEVREGSQPPVDLRASVAGREHVWRGRIVRTEGEINPRTRMFHAVAQVENPYGRGENGARPPLAVGLFVQAQIHGRSFPGVVRLPRTVLSGPDRVLVVSPEDRLYTRKVEILHAGRDQVIIRSGLSEGERVCVSPIDVVVEGMKVRTQEQNGGIGSPGLENSGTSGGETRSHGAQKVVSLKENVRPQPSPLSRRELVFSLRLAQPVAQISKPAVSPISNRQSVRRSEAGRMFGRPAGWKPAIQQVWKPALRDFLRPSPFALRICPP
jgi:membrane fusion protein, multidrug efflux system